jgi:tRNA threonylcarbamoyladenosine biosynthesis protein TsaB
MRILCIDTSSSLASAAIATDERIIAESVFSCEKMLSARLMPEIDHLFELSGLTLNDIDLFAAAVGPGSFTGVRAGVAAVQGLALATGKPCVGFSTLALLAMNFPLAAHPVCPILDARKNEVYSALYDCSGAIPAPLVKDSVMPPEDMLDRIRDLTGSPVIFAGDGALRYRDCITSRMGAQALFAPYPCHTGHAANGVFLALYSFQEGHALEPAALLPVYLRATETEYAKLDRQKALHAK